MKTFSLSVVLFIMPLLMATPSIARSGVEIELGQFYHQQGDNLTLDMRIQNGGPDDVPVALYVLLNFGGVFYFYPGFTESAQDVATFTLPASYDTGYFELFSLPLTEPYPRAIDFTWIATLLNTDTNEFFGLGEQVTGRLGPVPTPTPTPAVVLPGVQMATIPAGTYTQGSPSTEFCRNPTREDQRQVTITRSFEMQTTEVTQELWVAMFGTNPSYWTWNGVEAPVDQVTWFDAVVFCNRLSEAKGYRPAYYSDSAFAEVFAGEPPVTSGTVYWDKSANGFRLPTEAEWEYAARAGTTTPFAFPCPNFTNCSFDVTCLDSFGWYTSNGRGRTHLVGQLAPNAWGLYDMHGNVWEWTYDWWNGEYTVSPQTDPSGPDTAPSRFPERILRGGSYYNSSGSCRSAARHSEGPHIVSWHIGFRIARTP